MSTPLFLTLPAEAETLLSFNYTINCPETRDNEITTPRPPINSESVCSITGLLISLYMVFSL